MLGLSQLWPLLNGDGQTVLHFLARVWLWNGSDDKSHDKLWAKYASYSGFQKQYTFVQSLSHAMAKLWLSVSLVLFQPPHFLACHPPRWDLFSYQNICKKAWISHGLTVPSIFRSNVETHLDFSVMTAVEWWQRSSIELVALIATCKGLDNSLLSRWTPLQKLSFSFNLFTACLSSVKRSIA